MSDAKGVLAGYGPAGTLPGVDHPITLEDAVRRGRLVPEELHLDDPHRGQRPDARTYLILSDLHVPFHDEALIAKVCQLAVDIRPRLAGVILNGDFLDLYTLGSYNRDSLRKLRHLTLDAEYAEGNRILDMLDTAIPRNIERHFLFGNHEDRYWRELDHGDTGKYGDALRSPHEALRLVNRGYRVYDNWKQDFVRLGEHLEVTHGVYTPVHVAKKHLDEFQGSVIVGHSHRLQSYVTGRRGAWNFGFLGQTNSEGFHYVSRTKRNTWTQSFGLVDIDDHGDFFVSPIQVHNGRFVCDGRFY